MQTAPRSIRSKRVQAIEKRFRKPLPELLRKLYWDDKLTQADIADRLGVPAGTIGGWMVRFGLDHLTLAEHANAEAAKELVS